MSVLNINELKILAENGLLGNEYLENNFQPSSYDLRIGSIFKDGKIYSENFEEPNFTNIIEVKPSEIVSILTLEKVTMPKNCIGTVFAVNKQSSTGLLILNPGHIDPGFSGFLSICAINLSKEIRFISLGEPIFSLIVQKLQTELKSDEVYKNHIFTNRKEYEQNFLKNKSKKLSNSFFDLITSYEGAKKLLSEKLLEWFWDKMKSFGKIIAVFAGLAGIITLGYYVLPTKMPVYKPEENEKNLKTIKSKDSIINLQKKRIIILTDSLKKAK